MAPAAPPVACWPTPPLPLQPTATAETSVTSRQTSATDEGVPVARAPLQPCIFPSVRRMVDEYRIIPGRGGDRLVDG